jgi:hypothetical protein
MNDLPVVVPRVMVAKQAVDADLTPSALMNDLPVVVPRGMVGEAGCGCEPHTIGPYE